MGRMYKKEVLDYYSRKDIQKAILEHSQGREIVPVMPDGRFGRRPNAVFYEKDIEALVKEGAVSLHGSVERWSDPLRLKRESTKKELDALRAGWDLIIDIDCDHGLEYAKKAALVIADALEQFGIKGYGIKFSGNRGFHIGVPFESFPAKIMGIGDVEKQFPEIPKAIIEYLSYFTRNTLKKEFGEEPTNILKLDAAVAASRHLIRLPYCIHRKTGLVSIPLNKEDINGFQPGMAEIRHVETSKEFLKSGVEENEGLELMRSALFWKNQGKKETASIGIREFTLPPNAIPPEYFPPCMKNIIEGLTDGKKRSVFVLITYLHHIGWKRDAVESFLYEWNQKNKEPLKDLFIKNAVQHQYSRKKPQMAPNCDNTGYYADFGVCNPDGFCKVINNPVTYTLRHVRDQKDRRKQKSKTNKKGASLPSEEEQWENI